jgi:N-acetylneuraminate lyase
MSTSAELSGPRGPLRGALAASVTPLSPDGAELDLDAVASLVDMYVDAGLTGVMVGGTTGEGVLMTVDERCRLTDAFIAAAGGRIDVVVHAGAQSTADTASIAERAAASGATAVSVIAPPYFRLDDAALLEHMGTAASVCSPTPFYIYEFADRSGYPVPVEVLQALADRHETFVGLKVSDAPLERFAKYALPWLDVLVGPESLIAAGYERGAIGAVSALASAIPEAVVQAVVKRDEASTEWAAQLRRGLERQPLHASLKCVLRHRGIPINEAVRAPLRPLTESERESLLSRVDGLLAAPKYEMTT